MAPIPIIPLWFIVLISIILAFIGGWLLEFFYKSLTRKRIVWPIWQNLLLYVIAGTIASLVHTFWDPPFLIVVLSGVITTTGVEFLMGWWYLKYKNKRLWDYSDIPLNYRGIISMPFSIIWLVLFLIYYYYVIAYLL